mgnify:CR=1 FL=1
MFPYKGLQALRELVPPLPQQGPGRPAAVGAELEERIAVALEERIAVALEERIAVLAPVALLGPQVNNLDRE